MMRSGGSPELATSGRAAFLRSTLGSAAALAAVVATPKKATAFGEQRQRVVKKQSCCSAAVLRVNGLFVLKDFFHNPRVTHSSHSSELGQHVDSNQQTQPTNQRTCN